MRNYTKRKLAACGLCASLSMPVTAGDSATRIPEVTEVTQKSDAVNPTVPVPWDIIGIYAAELSRTEKFFKPAIDCKLISTSNMIIQLEHCKSIRKGWLKI